MIHYIHQTQTQSISTKNVAIDMELPLPPYFDYTNLFNRPPLSEKESYELRKIERTMRDRIKLNRIIVKF
jgi:hypothetical protein